MSLKFARVALISLPIVFAPEAARGATADLVWPVCDISKLARLPEKDLPAPEGVENTTGTWWQSPASKIYLQFGTPVFASGGGYVLAAETIGPFGETIDIAHVGNLFTRYAHLNTTLVKRGQRVLQGEQIGTVGSSGRSARTGLYFAVHNNDILLAPENLLHRSNCRGGTFVKTPPQLRGTMLR